jgi:putative FmdB family regulatory protein
MLILFDYACPCCKHQFEALVPRELQDQQSCPRCHLPAKRQLSSPRLDTRLGVDAASFPTLGDKWVRNRNQRQKIEEARKREHGD